MINDIFVLIGTFIGGMLIAGVPILFYFLWRDRKIRKNIPDNMNEQILITKLAEQEVKHEREKRRLEYELGRRGREREPVGDIPTRIESLQAQRTDDERNRIQDSVTDVDRNSDDKTGEADELYRPDPL